MATGWVITKSRSTSARCESAAIPSTSAALRPFGFLVTKESISVCRFLILGFWCFFSHALKCSENTKVDVGFE